MKIKKSLMTVLVASALLCSLTTACAPAHEHSWGDGEVTTQPTCTTEGVKTFTCECGETKTEAVAATGHSFGAEWEFDNDGHWHVCSVCDATSDKLDHTSATDCDDCDYEVVVPADPAFDLSAVAMEEREGNAYYVITGTYAADTEDQIKIRQPLSSLTYDGEELDDFYEQIIVEEVNVKTVKNGDKLLLDKILTPDLIEEGRVRELIRAVQSARKHAGLRQDDQIKLSLSCDIPKRYEDFIKSEVGAVEINQNGNYSHDEIAKLNGESVTISLEKI